MLVYRPWVPREGMAGMFRHLCAAWGDPNDYNRRLRDHPEGWPQGILEQVCERGKGIPVVVDRDATTVLRYPAHIHDESTYGL